VPGSANFTVRFVSRRTSVFFIRSRNCSGVAVAERQNAEGVLQQSEHSGHLSFGGQIDLQSEMTAFVGLTCESVLAGQDEQRQKDGLE
jgi:hypothetical protein